MLKLDKLAVWVVGGLFGDDGQAAAQALDDAGDDIQVGGEFAGLYILDAAGTEAGCGGGLVDGAALVFSELPEAVADVGDGVVEVAAAAFLLLGGENQVGVMLCHIVADAAHCVGCEPCGLGGVGGLVVGRHDFLAGIEGASREDDGKTCFGVGDDIAASVELCKVESVGVLLGVVHWIIFLIVLIKRLFFFSGCGAGIQLIDSAVYGLD